jgi:3alpha(or 20beta)-hydroxysteroid dehydrogenase
LLDLHYRVNVRGVFLGMHTVYQTMIEAGGGAIVNIASGAGARGYPGLFAYAGSKWMARGLTKCAAVDLAKSAVRVNAILPGLIDTPMLGENSPEYLRQLTQMVPMGRLGSAEEVAEAALYLASDAASYVSGAEIAVCGALMS